MNPDVHYNNEIYLPSVETVLKQGVALTGRNRTGPPCSVGRTAAGRPARRQCYTIRQQTTTDVSVQNNTGALGKLVRI